MTPPSSESDEPISDGEHSEALDSVLVWGFAVLNRGSLQLYPIIISPITAADFEKLKAAGASNGFPISGSPASVKYMGVDASIEFAEPTLTVTITDKPFYVTTNVIENKVRSAVAKTLQA